MPSFKRKRIPEYQGTTSFKKLKYGKSFKSSNLARKVDRLLSSRESKFIDVATASTAVGAGTNLVINVGPVAQGDGPSDRDGAVINWNSLQSAYEVSTVVNAYRVVYLYDTQTNGTPPTAADVFVDPANAMTPMNLNNRQRFIIVHDNFGGYMKGNYTIENAGTTSKHPCKFFKKLDLKATYSSSVTPTVPTTNGLFCIVLAGATAVTFKAYSRARFFDS